MPCTFGFREILHTGRHNKCLTKQPSSKLELPTAHYMLSEPDFQLRLETIETPLGAFAVHVGDGNGPTVVCWPSQIGDHRSMIEFAAQLMPDFRVVLIDPPGLGANSHIAHWPLLTQQVELADSVLEGLQISHCHWVGHGYGGHIGVGLATRFPKRLQSLTLTSVPFVQAMRITIFSHKVVQMLYQFEWGRKIAASFIARQLTIEKGYERTLVQAVLHRFVIKCNRNVLKQLRVIPPELLEHLRDMLKDIAIPAQVIAGKTDKSVLRRNQQTTAELLQVARYHEVDSGFMTLLVRPKECAKIFKQFASDVDVTSKPSPLATITSSVSQLDSR